MRYFVPDIRLASELPTQSHVEDKLGGLPWGLAAKSWPRCNRCGKVQLLLAQFVHDASRLDLEREGRSLFVFQCGNSSGLCPTWKGGSGANACFVVEPEVRIVQWTQQDDGLTSTEASVFFDAKKWDSLDEELREALFTKSEQRTRLGGVPHWIQGPQGAPMNGWRFAGQLDSLYRFMVPPQSKNQGLRAVKLDRKQPDLTYFCDGPNFGDGGMGYIFLDNKKPVPQGWFFSQSG
jgi:hypothetical protein